MTITTRDCLATTSGIFDVLPSGVTVTPTMLQLFVGLHQIVAVARIAWAHSAEKHGPVFMTLGLPLFTTCCYEC